MVVVGSSPVSQAWWQSPETPGLRKLTQEDCEFEASFGMGGRGGYKTCQVEGRAQAKSKGAYTSEAPDSTVIPEAQFLDLWVTPLMGYIIKCGNHRAFDSNERFLILQRPGINSKFKQ